MKKIHLFHGLADEQLKSIAEDLLESSFPPGVDIIKQGEEGNSFYLIYSGSVKVKRTAAGDEGLLAALAPGDYFGEESLITHAHNSATVTAHEQTLLLVLSRSDFTDLLKQFPKLRTNLEVIISSRRLARRVRFKWLREGEVVYFLGRKHPIMLLSSMIAPVLALVLPLVFIILFMWTGTALFIYLTGAAVLGVIAWVLWNWLDWGNDYYVVTNQRVIWLEKVIGLYDSRQEAPLSTILSVGVETDQLGRILNYGDVIVRTYVGRILFRRVGHPHQAASLVEEHWIRTREAARKADAQAMKQALRERLGLAETQSVPETAAEQAVVPSPYRPGLLQVFFANLFKVRFEESGTITYRKHWFVLFLQTLKPGLLLLSTLIAIIYRSSIMPAVVANPAGGYRLDAVILALLIGSLGGLLWWLYEYVDWSNDIFQVTSEEISDIDRKPLGKEEKKSAPLDNILSTEYKRIGFLQVLLNYGTVYITVGGSQLAFEDVYNPPAVQQDIDQRRVTRIERSQEAQTQAERERMADWITTYHDNVEEMRREEEKPKPDDKPDKNGVK